MLASRTLRTLIALLLLTIVALIYITQGNPSDVANSVLDNEVMGYARWVSTYLGDRWQAEQPYKLTRGDLQDSVPSLRMHSVIGFQIKDDTQSYVRIHFLLYDNAQSTAERFEVQYDWIFVRDYGVPPSEQSFPYREVPVNTALNASDHYFGCQEPPFIVNCGALLLYERLIVFTDVFLSADGQNYFDDDEFALLVTELDRILVPH